MKKTLFFASILLFISCDKDEIDNKVNEYQSKPKSEDLKGFWQLKGLYKPKESNRPDEVAINNGTIAGIGLDEILFLDNSFLRFLNKSNNSDEYSCNSKNRFYWYNENNLIKSLHKQEFSYTKTEIVEEFQLPYKFGDTKDTLIVQNGGKVMFLLKKENIDYTEYTFE